jgi:hypothetical protein
MPATTEQPAAAAAFSKDDWWVILEAVANEAANLGRSLEKVPPSKTEDEVQEHHAHLESLVGPLYQTWYEADPA